MTDLWNAAQRLIGRWEGPATGRPGKGRQVREYKSILAGHFIQGSDQTHWDPSTEEPNGSLHEGLAVLSFDRRAGELVMRSFYSEGLIHDYRCRATDDESRLVFEAAQVEGGPPGMRARETIVLTGSDALESTFELAMPGGDFESYTFERLTRIAD
jgi:hypothetical protein